MRPTGRDERLLESVIRQLGLGHSQVAARGTVVLPKDSLVFLDEIGDDLLTARRTAVAEGGLVNVWTLVTEDEPDRDWINEVAEPLRIVVIVPEDYSAARAKLVAGSSPTSGSGSTSAEV